LHRSKNFPATGNSPGFFRLISAALLCAGLWLSLASVSFAQTNDNSFAPDLPSPVCDSVQAPSGHRLAFRVRAVGVQRYRWNGASWDFVEPVATLFADANQNLKAGIHYGGPTWESNYGGKIVATRVAACSPDPTAIPWLLLQTTATDSPGILNSVTFIQPVNTKGGLAPTAPGSTTGVVAEVPDTTEYYFYRAENRTDRNIYDEPIAPPARTKDRIEPNAGKWRTWVISSGRDYRVAPPPGRRETRAELRMLAELINQNDEQVRQQIAFSDAGAPAYRWIDLLNARKLTDGWARGVCHCRLHQFSRLRDARGRVNLSPVRQFDSGLLAI
jgi:hypothetical protein